MNKSINLNIDEHEDSGLKKKIQTFRVISLGVLTFIVVSAVSLFFLILASPLPELRNQENAAALKLRELRNTSAKHAIIRERLGGIEKIISKRPVLDKIVTQIRSQLPEGVTIDDLRIDEESATVTVSSSSLLSLNSFIEALILIKDNDGTFSSLTLSEVQYDNVDPRYTVMIRSNL